MRTPVADEPAAVRRAFLTTLYAHLSLSVGATALATLVLAQPARDAGASSLHLLPVAGVWAGSLAGFARARGVLKRVLGVVAHIAAAGLVGAAIALVLELVNRNAGLELYPIVRRSLDSADPSSHAHFSHSGRASSAPSSPSWYVLPTSHAPTSGETPRTERPSSPAPTRCTVNDD